MVSWEGGYDFRTFTGLNMKRPLAIVVVFLVFFSLIGKVAFSTIYSRGGAPGFIGHFHLDGDDGSPFHYHPISEHGSLISSGQSLDQHQMILPGRIVRLTVYLQTSFSLISRHQERAISFITPATLPIRASFIYLGISSGGIPL